MRAIAGAFVIACCVFAGVLAFAQGQPPATQGAGQQTPPATPPGQGQPPGPGGQPARGGFQPPPPQNLKVLPKNWTRQQVQALMATFSQSLGLNTQGPGCDHCHAVNPTAPPPQPGRGPQLDYALDDKPEKEIARKMIQMVAASNDTYLKDVGDKAVSEKLTCWTCHRGQSKPQSEPDGGWTRGGFSLKPEGPPVGRGRGGI